MNLFTVLMQGWKCVAALNFIPFYTSKLGTEHVRKYITTPLRYVYHLYLENIKTYRDVVHLICLCNPTCTAQFCLQYLGSYARKLSHFNKN